VIEKPPFFMQHGGTQVIHINYFPAKVDNIYFPQHEVLGDIGNALWQITESIQPQSTWDFSYFMKVREQVQKHMNEKNESPHFPIIPQRVVADTRKAMPDDGIVCLDNGIYKIWFTRNYACRQQNTLLVDNALATMGAGLPSAMAAKIIFPDRKVMAVCGDGGFMMNSQEMETAVRLKLDLVIVILNDNAYGMIKWKQESAGFTDFGLDLGNPDFVKYAESYGANGYRITTASEYEPLLKKCLHSRGIHLIEVPMDYSENALLVKELKERVCVL
jgi:acetolactate synthase-1/2/3 large subunit